MHKRNITFAICTILVLLLVCLFNFIVDPYNLRKHDNRIDIHNNINLLNIFIKFSQKTKYEYLIVGGSGTGTLFDKNRIMEGKSCALLILEGINIADIPSIINPFLNVHPETKYLIFVPEIFLFGREGRTNFPKYTSNRLNFSEFTYIYLSMETTKKSLKKIFSFINKKENINRKSYSIVFPKRVYKQSFDYYKIHSKFVLMKIFERIKEKHNTQIIYLFPPYHALFLSQLYGTPYYQDIAEYKKLISEKEPYFYDMQLINKYSSKELEENHMYLDVLHPNCAWTPKINRILNNEQNAEKDIYEKVTANNIDKVLQKEKRQIENYIKTHKKLIEEYNTYNIDRSSQDYNYKKIIPIK